MLVHSGNHTIRFLSCFFLCLKSLTSSILLSISIIMLDSRSLKLVRQPVYGSTVQMWRDASKIALRFLNYRVTSHTDLSGSSSFLLVHTVPPQNRNRNDPDWFHHVSRAILKLQLTQRLLQSIIFLSFSSVYVAVFPAEKAEKNPD